MQLVLQAHTRQRLHSTGTALLFADTGQRHGQFDVGQHGLVRNQVITLEDETDGMVAVGIPIAVAVLLGGDTADDKVPCGIAVQTADNIEQRRFAAAGRPQHRHKLAVAEPQVDTAQCLHVLPAGGIYFCNGF